MKKHRYLAGTVCGLAVCLMAAGVYGGDAGKYEIKKGDTLWDISRQQMGNPLEWPRVWKENPGIKNPDRIYPGQVIALPGEGSASPAVPGPLAEPAQEAMAEAPAAEGEKKAVEAMPAAPEPVLLAGTKTVLFSGFITRDSNRYSRVLPDADDRAIYGAGDTVLSETGRASMNVGDLFTISRPLRAVVHPATGGPMGDLMTVLGVARVKGIQKGVASLAILDSNDIIMAGDLLAPYEEAQPVYEDAGAKTSATSRSDLSGYVIDMKEERRIAGQFDVVYIDRGSRHGVAVGNTFNVVREGQKESALREDHKQVIYPDEVVAQLRVIALQNETATALVSKSSREISRGYRIAAP